MGAVFSSAAGIASAFRAAKNYRQRSLITPDATASDHHEEYDCWSAMPDDLLFSITARLDVQSIRRSGAVCTSWRHTHNAFNLAALEKAPCLLYACEEYGPNDLALYCPTTDATFRVPFPGQPHDKRGFTFSCPGGWVFTTDEVGDPYLINPLTGVQAVLPPVKTIHNNVTWYDSDGRNIGDADPEEGRLPIICWARHVEYLQVAISTAADISECTVVIVHMPEFRVSFARPGDKTWTSLSEAKCFVSNIIYNDADGLFYILYFGGSISTLDLSGSAPKLTEIIHHISTSTGNQNIYLTHGPSGELLQIWRNWEHINPEFRFYDSFQEIVNGMCKDYVDLAGEDHDDNLSEVETNDEEDELYKADAGKNEIDVSQLLREGIDLPHQLVDAVTTIGIVVFKVDIKRQKLVEQRDIGDYALFLGLNSAVCLPTKDFPVFEPNCAYLTDDCYEYTPMLRKDLGIWNIKKRRMQKLGKAWPNMHPWLHLPPPIWIMPRF